MNEERIDPRMVEAVRWFCQRKGIVNGFLAALLGDIHKPIIDPWGRHPRIYWY